MFFHNALNVIFPVVDVKLFYYVYYKLALPFTTNLQYISLLLAIFVDLDEKCVELWPGFEISISWSLNENIWTNHLLSIVASISETQNRQIVFRLCINFSISIRITLWTLLRA